MKKLFLALALALGLATLVKADVFYGWDGPCEVYFRPYYGYYEVCDSYPSFLGYNWGSWGWRYGFNRTNTWYGNNRYDWRRRWQGNQWRGNQWHGNNFHGGPRGGAHPRGGHPAGGHPRGH